MTTREERMLKYSERLFEKLEKLKLKEQVQQPPQQQPIPVVQEVKPPSLAPDLAPMTTHINKIENKKPTVYRSFYK